MATLDDLLASMPGYLQGQIKTPDQVQQAAQQQYDFLAPTLLDKYGKSAQAVNENTFGRGFGLSTYAAEKAAENAYNQNLALGQLHNQALRDAEAAQNAAIGNAANYASAEAGRRQQSAIQKSSQNFQRSMQNRNAIIGGIGGLASGVGGIAAKALTSGGPGGAGPLGKDIQGGYNMLKGLFGGGGGAGEAGGNGVPAMPSDAGQAPSSVPTADMAGGLGGGASFDASPSFTSPSFDAMGGDAGFQMPDFSSWYGSMPSPSLYDLWGSAGYGQDY